MALTNAQTFAKYAQRAASGQNGADFENDNGTVIAEGRTLYSYGTHFPLCHILNAGEAVVTAAKYSKTTSRHTTAVASALRKAGVKVQFSDLAAIRRDVNKTGGRAYIDGKAIDFGARI